MSTWPTNAPGRKPEPTPARNLPTRFADFWWIEIPAKLRRYSILLWAAWSDGAYLTAWPRLALILVCAVFLFGFVEGATHWSYRTIVGSNGFAGNVLAPSATADGWGGPTRLVFAENLVLLMVAVIAGSLSANFGLTLVLGYALGDLLHGPAATGPGWRHTSLFDAWVYRHVPLLVTYVLFCVLVAMTTIMARELVKTAHPRLRQSRAFIIGLTAVVQALLVFGWSYMAPMVFRTVWLWSGGEPRIQVGFYSDVILRWVVPLVIVAVVLRAVLENSVENKPPVVERTQAIARQVTDVQPWTPAWLSAIVRAAVITLLIAGFLHSPGDRDAGILANFVEAEIIFACLAAVLLIWMYVMPRMKFWSGWTGRVNQYPPVLRLAVASAAAYLVAFLINVIPGAYSVKPGEFGPEVTGIVLGFVLTLALLPDGWLAEDQQQATWGSRSMMTLPNSAAAQVASVLAIVFLASKRAFADCDDRSCCFLGHPWTAAGSVGGSIPALGGIGSAGKRHRKRPVAKPCAQQQEDYDKARGQLDVDKQLMNKALADENTAQTAFQAADNQAKALWATIKSDLGWSLPGFITPGASQDPADFSQSQLAQIGALNDPNIPAFLNAVQAAKQAMAAYNQADQRYKAAEQQYQQDEQNLLDALKALQHCLATHGLPLASPLGAPPQPPSLASPLGAPPPPKSG